MIFLTCVTSSEITDERPTSEPVPAVVGTATNHGSGCVDRPHLRMVPRVLEDVARVLGHQRDRLRDVERGAAADADDAVGTMRTKRCGALHHLAAHRIAADARIDGVRRDPSGRRRTARTPATRRVRGR